jgi:hypothetical protein
MEASYERTSPAQWYEKCKAFKIENQQHKQKKHELVQKARQHQRLRRRLKAAAATTHAAAAIQLCSYMPI